MCFEGTNDIKEMLCIENVLETIPNVILVHTPCSISQKIGSYNQSSFASHFISLLLQLLF